MNQTQMNQAKIFVTIAPYGNNSDQNQVIDVQNGGLVVNTFDSTYNTTSQIWQLIPNLSISSSYGAGYTLYNPANDLCAFNQGYNNQVILNDDPTPFADASYCWTMFPGGTASNGQSYFTLQDPNRNLCMCINGGYNQPDYTSIILWSWIAGNPNNELWLFTLVPAANIPQGWQYLT
jgi:hypothetical protein